MGPEAGELLPPLDVLSYVTRGSGQLADSYTAMLRAINVSEKHHGEEGMRCVPAAFDQRWCV